MITLNHSQAALRIDRLLAESADERLLLQAARNATTDGRLRGTREPRDRHRGVGARVMPAMLACLVSRFMLVSLPRSG